MGKEKKKRGVQRSAGPKEWSRAHGKRLGRTTATNNMVHISGLLFYELPNRDYDAEIVDYNQMRDRLVSQDSVSSKYRGYKIKHHQTSAFISLPEELIMMIFSFLPHSDICTMAVTCKSIAEFVNRNFVPSLILPLSPHNLRKLDGRYVLSLKSTYNIMILQKYKKGEYLKNLEKVRIERLQKLVFVLYEYSGENLFPVDHILPPLYKDILSKYLSKSKELTHLHVAIDRSIETFDMIDVIATTLPHLTKVVLQATNTPNNVPYPIECETTQEIKDDARDLQLGPLSNILTLNELLSRLLQNTAIRSLEILGLYLAQNWDGRLAVGESYALEIFSDNLQKLRIEQDALCFIYTLECPELLEFRYVDYGGENFQVLECLIHHQIFDGGFKTMLCYSCPKLERINNIDLKSLRSRIDYSVDDPFNIWHQLLKSICHCESDDEDTMDDEDSMEEQ